MNTRETELNLEPCPFCGDETIEEWAEPAWSGVWRWKYCTNCLAEGPHVLTTMHRSDDGEQDRLWNRRAQ